MADDRKYSSLYSAIQSISRRPRRYSDSPFFRDEPPPRPPARRRNHESFSTSPVISEDPPSPRRDRQMLARAQLEAERSPRARSLLKIPSVMDNELETYHKPDWGSRGNPVIYESEENLQESPAASMTVPFDEGDYSGHRSLQGSVSLKFPRNTKPYLEGNDMQALSAPAQVPTLLSTGSGHSSRNASPSHKFSQPPRQSSLPVYLGAKNEANQGLRTLYISSDPTITPLPGSFQNAPETESMQVQLAWPSQNMSQVSGPSNFAPPFDSGTVVSQAPRNSSMPLDPIRTSLHETFQYAPGMENRREQFLLPSQKFSQVSRPSTSAPPFDNGSESSQGPRKSYIPMDPVQTSLSGSFEYAPGMESMQAQAVAPPQKFSQVSRPSNFAPLDSRNEVAQRRPRRSSMPLESTQTSLTKTFEHAPGMESMLEQVLSPSQRSSHVSRPSASGPPFDSGNESSQGPRKSYVPLDPMQTFMSESDEYAPGMESMPEQVVSPLQRSSQVSWTSTFAPPFDSGNEASQGPRKSYMPSNPLQTSIPYSAQLAPGIERMQEQVLSPSHRFSQASRPSAFAPAFDSGNESVQDARKHYMPLDPMQTSEPESAQYVLGQESMQELSPSQKFSQASRPSASAPAFDRGSEEQLTSPSVRFSQFTRPSSVPSSIGSEEEENQSPGTSYTPSAPASLWPLPGVESVQEQGGLPSMGLSQASRQSTMHLPFSENKITESPKSSVLSLNHMHASLPGSFQSATGIETEEQVAPTSHNFSQFSPLPSAPSRKDEDEFNQRPRASSRLPDSKPTFSQRYSQSAPGMDSLQEQLALPSCNSSEVPLPSSIPPIGSENEVNQCPRLSQMHVNSMRTSLSESSMPGRHLQRPSSLSFSRHIQKRSSLGSSLAPLDPGANPFTDTGNSTSDSSSDEVLHDKRLSLETVSRPSFAAKLNEQQSMVRPWDTERLTDTEKRARQEALNNLDGFADYSLKDPTGNGSENANARAFDQNEPETLAEGMDQQPPDSVYGGESLGFSEQGYQQEEEKRRGSEIYTPSPPEDADKMHSFSIKGGRKSMVQEFIYPSSSPREPFQESLSPKADQQESLAQEVIYQSSSPRFSVRQSLGSSRKDLTQLQTQEFMYSPSLARTTTEQNLDGQDQAMIQSTVTGVAEEELENRVSSYPSTSGRQSFAQLSSAEPAEPYGEELQYKDPTYPSDLSDDNNGAANDREDLHDFSQQHLDALTSGALYENELNDDEYFDDALAAAQQEASEIASVEDNNYVEDPSSAPSKDDLHSESFANLEHSLGSFKRALGSSVSFVRVPFGASELSYEGFAKMQFIEPTAGIWPVAWKSVTIQDLIRFSKDPITQPLLQRLTDTPHKQCAVTTFTHLLAYMGVVPTEQEFSYHIQQILMMGIKYRDFRDEIFCQICKQTTANPNSWSNGRGWQAMALCVGTFAPSSTFRPFLEAHLQQVAGNFVEQWAGDTMSYQDAGISKSSKAAEYCLARFQKLLQAGPRRLPPLHAEISAVEKLETVPVKFYLPDDTFKAVRDVAYGVYPVEEHDAVMLGSLQLRADSSFFENLEEALTDEMVRKFGPNIYVKGSERDWKEALLRTAAALPAEGDMSICINDYIDFLRSRCTLYGSCWYYVKQRADPRLPHEMFVAVNTAGVYFVHFKTKEQLLHMQFTEICSWGYSSVLFSLVTGNMMYNHDHRLITRQGAEIGATLQMYINRLQN